MQAPMMIGPSGEMMVMPQYVGEQQIYYGGFPVAGGNFVQTPHYATQIPHL